MAAAEQINIAILGGTGYGAGELLRLLTQHPYARVVAVTSTSQAGEAVENAHPHLRGFYDGLRMESALPWERLLDGTHAVLFSALPNGASGPAVAQAMEEARKRDAGERVRLIDLSGDLRLQDPAQHQRHYPETPALEGLRPQAAYGLPELNRAGVKAARLIANPGCLATAAILAAAPLMECGVAGPLVIDAKTGSSGSGRQLKETTHHPTRHADFRAYKPLSHQHEPEIVQALAAIRPLDANRRASSGDPLALSFVAQSMDTTRGIFATVHALLAQETTSTDLPRRFEMFYAHSPFVRIVAGSPTLQEVVGSNFCDIALAARGRQVIVMAALDNLVKGMAGTAIQNMNLMCGLDEKLGLWTPSLRPL